MRGSYQRECSSVGTSGSILVEYTHTHKQPLDGFVSDYHMHMSDTSHSHIQSLILTLTPFTLTLIPSPHPILSPSPHLHTSFSHPHPIPTPYSLILTPFPHLILAPPPISSPLTPRQLYPTVLPSWTALQNKSHFIHVSFLLASYKSVLTYISVLSPSCPRVRMLRQLTIQ